MTMTPPKKTGVILGNLGSPASYEVEDIRKYLAEFLGDPFVLAMPKPLRWLLLNLIILPRRPIQTSQLYRNIWDKLRGSPLIYLSEDLRSGVDSQLPDTPVASAMRYGEPSLDQAISKLKKQGVSEILFLPLYPQYAGSSTETSLVHFREKMAKNAPNTTARTIDDFFDQDFFITESANVIRESLNQGPWDHLLLSYHGLPWSHMTRAGCEKAKACRQGGDCGDIGPENRRCYRAQSIVTSKLITKKLGISPNLWSIAYQSRLGTGWMGPFTDKIISNLRNQGVERLVVACPSFTVDCLETLEEIGIRIREDWRKLGGKELRLVPCLNDRPGWVAGLSSFLASQVGRTDHV